MGDRENRERIGMCEREGVEERKISYLIDSDSVVDGEKFWCRLRVTHGQKSGRRCTQYFGYEDGGNEQRKTHDKFGEKIREQG